MFCSNCGNKVGDNARFCGACGSKLTGLLRARKKCYLLRKRSHKRAFERRVFRYEKVIVRSGGYHFNSILLL